MEKQARKTIEKYYKVAKTSSKKINFNVKLYKSLEASLPTQQILYGLKKYFSKFIYSINLLIVTMMI